MIILVVLSLLLQQSATAQQFPYYQPFPIAVSPPLPRMYVSQIQLVCEVASPAGKLRWIRRGSTMDIGTAVKVAEGTLSADPLKYAVTLTSDRNDYIRSTLTLLTPQPNLQQVWFIQPIRNATLEHKKKKRNQSIN